MQVRTLWRTMLYKELENASLEGLVLDLGGEDASSEYHRLIQGQHNIQIANGDKKTKPNFLLDLENKLPFNDGEYDGVLCFNLLEHIYNYQRLLDESNRVLKSGGKIILAVPFLMPVHPSPHDYFRYSGEALDRMFKEAGFKDIAIVEVGTGPFGAMSQILYNAMHFSALRKILVIKARILDKLISRFDKKRLLSKSRYPLGYLVSAKK